MFMQIFAGVGEQHARAETHRHQVVMFVQMVTPLNEECGLLEWVNNTQGLRRIVTGVFMQNFAGVGEQHARAETHPHQAVMFVQTVTPLNEECGLLEWVNNTWEL